MKQLRTLFIGFLLLMGVLYLVIGYLAGGLRFDQRDMVDYNDKIYRITEDYLSGKSAAEIEKIVNSIEQLAYNNLQEEITTRQIGEMVMESLRKLDEVAYIRFASVYRSFTDIPTFMQELKALVSDKEEEEKE